MPTLALTRDQQALARARTVQAANLCYANKGVVHYTQGPSRWDGIRLNKQAAKGQYPNWADCSSFATWCIWNAVYLTYGMEDIVNGAAWQAGYTGTMLSHGTVIRSSDMLAGDCVIYGSGFPGHHTAICVGRSGSMPMVISHGSEAGPFYLPWNYRGDVMSCRRYIDGQPHQASGGSVPPGVLPTPPEGTVALTVATMKDGRFEVFVEDKNGQIWHTWQAKEGGWAGAAKGKNASWYSLGTPGK